MKRKLDQQVVRRIWAAGRASAGQGHNAESRWGCIWDGNRRPSYTGEILSNENGFIELDVLNALTGELSGEIRKYPADIVTVYRNRESLGSALSAFWKAYYAKESS